MSVKEDLQALESFTRSLGCETKPWGKKRHGLIAVRRVAGEDVTTYFRLPSASGPFIPKEDKQVLRNIRSESPRAHLRIITQFKPRREDIEQLDDGGIRVTTLLGYFNQVLDSSVLVSRTISNADSYIPSREYVEQRIQDTDQQAISYISKWLSPKSEDRESEDDASLLVVLAPAGHGKTCLAHHLARQLANKHLEDKREPIPFLMLLHLHRHVREFREFVLDYLEANHIHGITSSAFAYLVNIGRVIPILDGFDELAEIGGAKVARKTLQSLLREFSKEDSRSILTSRQSLFRHRGDISPDHRTADQFRIVELDKFNADERRIFFLKRGIPQRRLELHEQMIKSVSHDEDVPGNPLMLRLVVDAAQGRDSADLKDMSGATLLKFCLEKICERDIERQAHALPVKKQIDHMSFLAGVMFDDTTYVLEDVDSWLELIADEILPGGLTEDQRVDQKDKVMEMLRHHALLQVQVESAYTERSGISFIHPVYRDYLIAQTIAEIVDSGELGALSRQIKRSLPDSTKDYLIDIVNLPKMAEMVVDSPGSREFRNVLELLLRRCDKVSLDNLEQRTSTFTSGLGQIRAIQNQDLSGIEFRSLRFEEFSFQGTNLSESRFQDCHFVHCDFSGSLLYSARFFGCVADKDSADSLRAAGIEDIAVVEQSEGETQSIEAKAPDDPIRELTRRFLGRFVSERGKNKRTRQVISCLRGLGGVESHFTRREIIPEMCRAGVVENISAGRQEPTLMFNNSWQTDADSFIWDFEETERLGEITKRLRKKTGKYSLY